MGDEYTSTEHILLERSDSPEGKTLAAFGVTKDAVLALREIRQPIRHQPKPRRHLPGA